MQAVPLQAYAWVNSLGCGVQGFVCANRLFVKLTLNNPISLEAVKPHTFVYVCFEKVPLCCQKLSAT